MHMFCESMSREVGLCKGDVKFEVERCFFFGITSFGLEVLERCHTALGNSFLIHVVLNWKLFSDKL